MSHAVTSVKMLLVCKVLLLFTSARISFFELLYEGFKFVSYLGNVYVAFFYCEIDGSSLCLQCDMTVHVGGKRTHGRYLLLRQRVEVCVSLLERFCVLLSVNGLLNKLFFDTLFIVSRGQGWSFGGTGSAIP